MRQWALLSVLALSLPIVVGCEGASAPREVIVDNRDGGFGIIAGDWGVGDPTDGNGCYGADFRYHFADRDDVGRAHFVPNVPERGWYDVYIYWSAAPNRTTDQPVIVHDANGDDTVFHVNLQQHGNQWYWLSRLLFAPGTDCYIEFNTDTDDGYCNADAVRLVE